ncbi:MAG: hypothetical protein AB2805_11765, partial [Candidatus Thiodiazotropha sp.]
LVVHLASPNLSPRAPKEVPLGCALIGAFSGTTGPIGLVLTGPNTTGIMSLIFNEYPIIITFLLMACESYRNLSLNMTCV